MQKRWRIIGLLLLLVLLLTGCVLEIPVVPGVLRDTWKFPKDGLWYCAELQLQLCSDGPTTMSIYEFEEFNETYSYMMKNGQLFMCIATYSSELHGIDVQNQDSTGVEKLGATLMMLKGVELEKDTFIVQDESGKECVFTRIPYFSITDYLSQWEETEPIANVGELRYVGHVLERSELLWETAYADAQISKDAVAVSFDMESDCWLVGCPVGAGEDQMILMALARRNGDVLSVWQE